jgi:nickel-dependent lactate racemase
MTKRTFEIPYSKSTLNFSIPSTMSVDIATSKSPPPVSSIPEAVRTAMAAPIDSPPLKELANQGDKVCIVFTDITRSTPDDILVPALLQELAASGVKDEDITLLCGIGMHRPSTKEEKQVILSREITSRYRVIDNEPQNPDALLDLGTTPDSVPVFTHRAAVEADLLIATGIIEPHQYAGYSGGRKTVAIGAAGEPTIAYTHGPDFIDHPGTRLGQIEGNPFHKAVTEAAHRAGLRFIVNVVLDEDKNILRVVVGDPDAAFLAGVNFARTLYEVPITHQYDIAVGGVGYPKDSSLYQASRSPSYLFFAPTPVVRPGGFYIIPARCEEGAGEGVGEQRFLAAMRDAPNVQYIIDDARKNGYPPGQQRAFVLARVLEYNPIIIVGSEHPDLVETCKMIPAPTMKAAFELAAQKLGTDLEVLIVPHSLQTLPVLQTPE